MSTKLFRRNNSESEIHWKTTKQPPRLGISILVQKLTNVHEGKVQDTLLGTMGDKDGKPSQCSTAELETPEIL